MKPAIIAHGGAGKWPSSRQKQGLKGVKQAVEKAYETLKRDGTAIQAVEAAVMMMEDNEAFNAGLGSSLCLTKHIEMEASIMNGKTLSAGATALLNEIKNPIQLARIIMENTDHIFVVGKGAHRLAEAFNLECRNPTTTLRETQWRELRKQLEGDKLQYLPKLSKLLKSYPKLLHTDTVGAVAVDKQANVAAATSTGGLMLKIPGRIGDSPLIGCGNYADNETGACSATGIGEIAIKLVLAKTTCDLMRLGQTPQKAVETAIEEVNRRIKTSPNQMGLIAIDPKGRMGVAHNSQHMCWAYMTPQTTAAKAYLEAKSAYRDPEALL